MKDIPAFPVPSYVNKDGETHDVEFKGMTLRDYFAAKALDVSIQQTKDFHGIDKAYVATWCYEMADAMMKAREA